MQTAADMGKEIVIRFRADEGDRRRLEQLAKHEGMSPSTLLRVLLLRASRELGFESSPTQPKGDAPATPKKASKPKTPPEAKPSDEPAKPAVAHSKPRKR